jgi:hypothetical protein
MASAGNDQGRGLPSFPLPARTSRRGSILLLHLWQRKASLSKLMIATQEVGKNNDIGASDKERLVTPHVTKTIIKSLNL